MEMFRVACLGAGYFAQFHLDAWRRAEQAKLVAVADKDIEKAKQAGVAAFSSLTEMLDKTKPDILDIILPPDQQADAIKTAIDQNIKTVICQKPFCRSLAEARTITTAAAEAGLKLIIHENFRFQPWYQIMKDQLENGSLGTPYQVHFSLRPNDGKGKEAYLSRQPYFQTMPRFLVHETAIHFLDVFTFLLGGQTRFMLICKSAIRRLPERMPAISCWDMQMVGGLCLTATGWLIIKQIIIV